MRAPGAAVQRDQGVAPSPRARAGVLRALPARSPDRPQRGRLQINAAPTGWRSAAHPNEGASSLATRARHQVRSAAQLDREEVPAGRPWSRPSTPTRTRKTCQKVGRPTGLEPATPRFTILCSNQLSYDRREGRPSSLARVPLSTPTSAPAPIRLKLRPSARLAGGSVLDQPDPRREPGRPQAPPAGPPGAGPGTRRSQISRQYWN